MPRFHFGAIDAYDKPHSGQLEAKDREAALQTLSKKFKLVTDLEEIRPPLLERLRAHLAPGVSQDELLIFTQQLSAVIAAGLPLKDALEFVVGDSDSPSLVGAMEKVSTDVQQGTSVADALAAHPHIFPPHYVSMVRAGEASGNLAGTLEQLGKQLESAASLSQRVKSAFAYPTVVLIFACMLTLVIVLFGMPMVKDLYGSMGGQLPWPTQMLLTFSDLLTRFWLVWIFAAGIPIWLLRRMLHSQAGALAFDRYKLSIPVLGTLFRFLSVTYFARNFGAIYKAGVPILQALELTAPTVGSRVFQNILTDAVRKIADGSTLSACLRSSGFLPPLALGMVSAGEATGTLEVMLERVAIFYEARVDVLIKSLSAMVEPILMIGVGLMIGILIICVGMPFLNLGAMM